MRQKTLLKIVGLMRKDLNKGLTILEISKRLKIGYHPAYNHIIEMEKEGIVKVERVGSAKKCSLMLGNEKTRHLLEEVDIAKKEGLYQKNFRLRQVEGLISKLTEKFISEIFSVVLFGSYAKETATKQSDIDILFIVRSMVDKKLREAIERECASYQYSHNLKISPLIVDIKEFKKMLSSKEINIGKEAKEQGVSLYGYEIFWRIIE